VAKGAGPFGWRLGFVSFLLSRRRLLPRPGCGVRPVLWKEMHVARSRVLTRLFLALVFPAVVLPLGWATWQFAVPAFRELAAVGYDPARLMVARQEFNLFLRTTLVTIYMLSGIALAIFCATSITSEKEQDTWTSLVATPLDALEIVGQKMIGAWWRLRWVGLFYLLLLALGVAAGAVHPLGGMLNLVQTTVFLGFAAGLGTFFSLRFRSSIHALGWTCFALFLINGGYLLGCFLLNPIPQAFFLVTPLVHAMSLATYSEVDWFLTGAPAFGNASDAASLFVLNTLFYGVATTVLCFCCVRVFEKVAGRPCRDRVDNLRSRSS
jgi:hypothetical protein